MRGGVQTGDGVEDVEHVFRDDVTIERNTVFRMEEFHIQVPDDWVSK